MKRYIKNSYELGQDVIYRSSIIIDIEFDYYAVTSSENLNYVSFPGKEQFRKDVLAVLENEYNFEVVEDGYNGILQKGWTSNKDDSSSIYFNAFYDMRNAVDAAERLGHIVDPAAMQGKIYCYILFRFSDHKLDSSFDNAHRDFYNANKLKHTQGRNDIFRYDDADVIVDEATLYQKYDEALDELRADIEGRIYTWIAIAKKRYSKKS